MIKRRKPISPENPATLEIEIPRELEAEVIDIFNIEIEVLQGIKILLPDNKLRIEVKITSQEKADYIDYIISETKHSNN